ncbi:hypothetical protein CCR80_13400 [Rhodothalassium salexigens]|uniref:DNA gyrase inhibitor YacG n=1 Tax=Rhodothalassium salexigens TaxID=1086 RepID=UPI00191487E1|nr:DNA gyrase inhibitor YacG [Rhodothalassium salexigens]MBK5922030.1 hypothetical protein [Rhodothalassium salexigens]
MAPPPTPAPPSQPSTDASSAAGRCPLCDKPTDPGYRPFCSKRCADVDLHRWLGEGYVLPGTAPADPDAWPTDEG